MLAETEAMTIIIHVFIGAVVHAPHGFRAPLEVLEMAGVCVREDTGEIVHVMKRVRTEEEKNEMRKLVREKMEMTKLRFEETQIAAGRIIIPGFVDVHVHAPQFRYTGTATDLPLLEWLDHYTFPSERELGSSAALARHVYSRCVRRLLRCGTTTAVYFATIDTRATKVLAEEVMCQGQRAVIGKVAMDRCAPSGYVETTKEALDGTRELIEWFRAQPSMMPRVSFAITPRFVPTCTPELLAGLGRLAAEFGDEVMVQSHISESDDMVSFVEHLHPETGRDTALFNDCGLLRHRSIFAHGTHLTPAELEILGTKNASIAHCPYSNFMFADREFHLKRAIDCGVRVGLGTDIAGGVSPMMLQAMRAAVLTSKAVAHAERSRLRQQAEQSDAVAVALSEEHAISFADAFWLGTAGGAAAIGKEDEIGYFDTGMQFDALIVDCSDTNPVFDVFPDTDTLLDRFQKFINLGEQASIERVFVSGKPCLEVRSPTDVREKIER